MTKKNLEELTDTELLEIYKETKEFINELIENLGESTWKKNI